MGTLSAAIVVAEQADVDAVDLARAEEKLKTLHAMTPEQHAAKAADEILRKQKRTAFTLVKKNDVTKFKELIDEVGEGVSWRDWRDPFGRTVWRCAKDLRALKMQEFLEQLGVGDEAKIQRPTVQTLRQIGKQHQQQEQKEQQRQQGREDMNQTQCISVPERTVDAPIVEQNPTPDLSECLAHSGRYSNCSTCPARDSTAMLHPIEQQQQGQEQQQQQQQEDLNQTQCIPGDEHREDATVAEQNPNLDLSECLSSVGMDSFCSSPCPAEDPLAVAKSKAFRAAAQDDCGTLNEIIESISIAIWSKWENRAGKTLLTLSEERRSPSVHLRLAKAFGIAKQLKRESFEVGECVWVYIKETYSRSVQLF